MKMHYKTHGGKMTFEIEGETQRALFAGIAQVQEVFEADFECGCCGNEAIRFLVRSVNDNEFFELECIQCRARLSFGQHKKGGTLFAKRLDDQHNPLPDYGWRVYQKAPPAKPTPFDKDTQRKDRR